MASQNRSTAVMTVHVPCYRCDAAGQIMEARCALDPDNATATVYVPQPCCVCQGRRWFESVVPVQQS
ncbi:MAG: hypothetical protein GEU94_06255 [Micromonosporaceae bacterium]|nr:hypothetical protein [Micromonosporaceae bacterium]